MKYTVVIRTLGKAGSYYQSTLNSVIAQTVPPEEILIYIAEGYTIPKETIGIEKYYYVPKGMVAQRALPYNEVHTEYCLFLDDDVYLPPDAVGKLYEELLTNNAQVISPCTFNNHKTPIKSKLFKTIMGKEVFRIRDTHWAFKVLRTAGFSYNNNPTKAVYQSQSNAGPCFFCRKEDFLKVHYDEESWLDESYYALPDDQVMFYKMHKKGLKVLTSFDTGIIHLDAGSSLGQIKERILKIIYSEYRNKLIFWHRFIFLPDTSFLSKAWSVIAIIYALGIQTLKYSLYYIIGRGEQSKAFWKGCHSGLSYIKSEEYKSLPRI